MAGNNENEIEEIINFNESAVMSNLGVHSTPNVGQDRIVELNLTDQTSVTEDSGVQLIPDVYKRQVLGSRIEKSSKVRGCDQHHWTKGE